MRLPVLIGLGMALPVTALACPPRQATAQATPAQADTQMAAADAAACAKSAELVGDACSYTTGMMAQRILSEGGDFAFTGSLVRASDDLESHVAAPFVVGGNVRVVANEVIETAPADTRVALTGKRLEVGGVQYFVVTEVTAAADS